MSHRVGAFNRFLDAPNHKEGLFRKIVVDAGYQFLETSNGILEGYELALQAGELRGHVERLREEPLNLSCPCYRELILLREFIDAKNRDDVLTVLIPLEYSLNLLSNRIMLLAHYSGIENFGGRSQRVDRRINPQFSNLARQRSHRVQMREGRCRRGIRIIVSWNINSLY